MTNFSTDADLLKWEPALMREIVLDHQCLTKGKGASSQTFAVIADGQFITNRVRHRHVVYLRNIDQGVDGCYEIVQVQSETELTAALVGGCDNEWVPLPTATDLEFRIQTFDPQHEEARWTLLTRFGLEADANSDRGEGLTRWIAEHHKLRRASVALVLATLYRGQATQFRKPLSTTAPEVSGLTRKAEHYASLYEDEVAKARLAFDRTSSKENG